MINIAICDDDIAATGKIESMLHKIAKNNFILIDTDVFWDGKGLADAVEKENYYDIIFLDIEMGQENGIKKNKGKRQERLNYLCHKSRKLYERILFSKAISVPIEAGR